MLMPVSIQKKYAARYRKYKKRESRTAFFLYRYSNKQKRIIENIVKFVTRINLRDMITTVGANPAPFIESCVATTDERTL